MLYAACKPLLQSNACRMLGSLTDMEAIACGHVLRLGRRRDPPVKTRYLTSGSIAAAALLIYFLHMGS